MEADQQVFRPMHMKLPYIGGLAGRKVATKAQPDHTALMLLTEGTCGGMAMGSQHGGTLWTLM